MVAVHLRTLFSSSAISILQEITTLSTKYGNNGHTIVFSLSTSFRKSEDLEAVFGQLVAFNNSSPATNKLGLKGRTLGCLVEPPSGIQLSQEPSVHGKQQDYISCSIGIFDSENTIPFRSELASEEQPQVGRWHSFRKTTTSGSDIPLHQSGSSSSTTPVDWEDVWARSSLQSDASPVLPEELRETNSDKLSNLIYFTAPHPTQLTTALSSHLPNTSCLGLIAAPTHFITGRAVTLVMDGKIYDTGAVGLAFKAPTKGNSRVECKTTFEGFHRLSEPMIVTQTEGNMLNAVKSLSYSESLNPTSLLLSAIQKANLTAPTFKESEDFAIAVLPSPPSDSNTQPRIERTYTITAGDPRNRGGALSLSAQRAPTPGSIVQFIHRPRNAPITLPSSISSSQNEANDDTAQITFVTVPEAPTTSESEPRADELMDAGHSPLTLASTFLATSSRGFLLSRPAESLSSDSGSASSTSWTATLPGTIASIDVAHYACTKT